VAARDADGDHALPAGPDRRPRFSASVLKPLLREKITDEFREVSWEEAISFVGRRFREIQAAHGAGSIGGITSSRTTNEEVYTAQRMIRTAFGNNNVDTCARVCHFPTGFGLKQTFGTSAGTQDFKSVAQSDVILLIWANPTDGHPVFASRMKKRLRAGAKLIYTTFHHPVTGANVVTTENSDWATNCPEYKVTAVQVALAITAESADLVSAGASADSGAGH
jgi:predicted molibdopterin-dependent oxidoreductase YjgC